MKNGPLTYYLAESGNAFSVVFLQGEIFARTYCIVRPVKYIRISVCFNASQFFRARFKKHTHPKCILHCIVYTNSFICSVRDENLTMNEKEEKIWSDTRKRLRKYWRNIHNKLLTFFHQYFSTHCYSFINFIIFDEYKLIFINKYIV